MDLNELRARAAVCTACDLHTGRNKPVFDKGDPTSPIMICGMVPADEENKVGLPFVGRAGKLLDQIISESIMIHKVYITNLVKCYLKAGLLLKQEWIGACFPYVITQIGLIKPKVILTLGKDATYSLLGLDNKLTLSKVRGKVFDFYSGAKIVPTYHPSFLLRGGGVDHKNYRDVVDDFVLAEEIAAGFT